MFDEEERRRDILEIFVEAAALGYDIGGFEVFGGSSFHVRHHAHGPPDPVAATRVAFRQAARARREASRQAEREARRAERQRLLRARLPRVAAYKAAREALLAPYRGAITEERCETCGRTVEQREGRRGVQHIGVAWGGCPGMPVSFQLVMQNRAPDAGS